GMLLDAGSDGEDIRIENNVFRWKADFLREQLVGAAADRDLALQRISLALLVERHDDDGGAVAAHQPGLRQEFLHSFLHGNRVHQRLALDALQPSLDHLELGGVDHDRHAGDIRLGGEQVQELDHDLLAVQEALVDIDVDDLSAVGDLVARDVEGGNIIAGSDQLAEARGASDVGPLADIDERNIAREREWLESGKAEQLVGDRHFARRIFLRQLSE